MQYYAENERPLSFFAKENLMNRIRVIPTTIHGIFDYVGAAGLIATPFIFGFSSMGGIAVILPIIMGVGLIIYSLLTDYELGVPALRVIPMRVHLTVDFVAAAFLAVAPFLFGYVFEGLNVWLPQVVSGVGVMFLVLVTKTESQTAYARRDENVRLASA
jgi:hypothetical protein